MLCNWASSKYLCDLWNKLGNGDYSFTKDGVTIRMVWEGEHDYIVIVNGTNHPLGLSKLKKTVFMVMEPVLHDQVWNWCNKNPHLFKAVFNHTPGNYNNNEWHLSLTRPQLKDCTTPIPKTFNNAISAILSDKYFDPGHKTRIDFALKAQKELEWHSYGGNSFKWDNYMGSPPMHQKDIAMLPYKYTFNMENQCRPGYYTEKLIDAIMAECLIFYSGPDDIEDHVDPKAYVKLDFNDIDGSIKVMKRAIEEDLHTKRLPYILEAKRKILDETGFFPRLHKTLTQMWDKDI